MRWTAHKRPAPKEENSMNEIRHDSRLVKLIAAQARGERVDSDQAEHAAR